MPQIIGQFPAGPTVIWNGRTLTANLVDVPQVSNSAWSPGAAITELLTAQPTIVKPWTITAWSLQGQGVLQQAGNVPQFGLLGKILASLVVGASGIAPTPPPPHFATFTQPPQSAMPNLQTLWDGSQDPPFPSLDPTATGLPAGTGWFGASTELPQPQQLNAGDQLGIGLWLTPSLIQGIGRIILYNCQYSVTYQ